MNGRLTITDVAKAVGVTPRTIMRWEKAGKIKKSKRDWRGWRFYYKEDIAEIKQFVESSYMYDEENGAIVNMAKGVLAMFIVALLAVFTFSGALSAEPGVSENQPAVQTQDVVEINLEHLPVVSDSLSAIAEDVKYTLGPNDVIEIEVRRHPEFSGRYTINSEGKIEYKFVGDIIVNELTKAELKEQLTNILSQYLIEPEVDVTIAAYLSKVFYVVGEVGRPGKFYMRGNTVTVREALVQAGLPQGTAAMRRSRLITPDNKGKNNYLKVDVCKLIYEGDLKQNLEMEPGDVLYVPPTTMTKIIRVVSPVTGLTGQAAGVARTGAGF
jgi:protein involved in polysaccharide export with SLBB domain